MKTLLLSIFIKLIFVVSIFPQSDPIQKAEILIKNSTNHIFTVKVFPVSADFSGYGDHGGDSSYFRKYSLKRSNINTDPFWPKSPIDSLKYIVGGVKTVQPNSYAVVDFDDGAYFDIVQQADKVIGGISYGLWKIEFYYTPDAQTEEGNIDLIADCNIDYRDINHGQYSFTNDIYFNLIRKPNSNQDSLVFNWKSGDTLNIYDSRVNNKIIKSWHKVGTYNPTYGYDPSIPGSPNTGLFKTLPYFFPNYPIDATEYGAVKHLYHGKIEMNMEIDSNGTKIKENKTLNFKNANISIKSGINFSMEDSSILVLDSSNFSANEISGLKTFIMGNNAEINLTNGSTVNFKKYQFLFYIG